MGATITQGYLDKPIFGIVSAAAEELGVRAFVIGGYVRDCFLGRPNDDIDIVVEGAGSNWPRQWPRRSRKRNAGIATCPYSRLSAPRC